MGFTIIPKCNNCNYQTNIISVGGGRANHLTHFGAPAWNIITNNLVQINLYSEIKKVKIKQKYLFFFHRIIEIEKMNEIYVPYYDSKMFINDKTIGFHNWNGKGFKKSKNFCPKCRTFNLAFLHEGIYFD
jgi:predicted nucleic-acid-binding Zn-ribbon protein